MNCPYRHILGKEGEGLHSYRIFNIAIIDVLFTLIGAFIISYLFNYNYFIVLIFLFILGIILHRVFCVNTTINKLIFGII